MYQCDAILDAISRAPPKKIVHKPEHSELWDKAREHFGIFGVRSSSTGNWR